MTISHTNILITDLMMLIFLPKALIPELLKVPINLTK